MLNSERRIAVIALAVGLCSGCGKERWAGLEDGPVDTGGTTGTEQPSTASPTSPPPGDPPLNGASGVGEGNPNPALGAAATDESSAIGCNSEVDAGCDCSDPTSRCVNEPACDAGTAGCGTQCPGCSIEGDCAAAGAIDPTNPCLICDPTRSASAWSPNDGVMCDDLQFCTIDDVCQEGACRGTARACEDGVTCNGDSTCEEATGTCSPPLNLCGQGAICDTVQDTCVTTCLGCLIENTCIANGAEEPGNPCRVCDISRSTTAYVGAAGKPCGTGATSCSQQDTCDADGVCQPNHLNAGTTCGQAAARPCDGVDTCDGNGNCSPRRAANGTPCDDGQFCTVSDTCQGGECLASTRNCGQGQVCNEAANACACAGCQIGGACVASGATSPTNPCLVCDPARNPSGFSPSTDLLCPRQGLVAYYPFNGDANDSSGQGNDCTVSGPTLTADRLGRSDRAFRFDGVDDSMVCGTDDSLEITGALSVAAWFSVGADSLVDINRSLLSKGIFSGQGATRAYALLIQNQNQSGGGLCGATNSATFVVSDVGTATPPNGTVCGGTAFQADTWHHAVGVFQPGSRVAVYIDGVLSSEKTTGVIPQVFDSTQPLRLGVNTDEFFQGSMDEIRIYNRALSQAEITALHGGTQ